jgi:RNA-splicing ligase RtcB
VPYGRGRYRRNADAYKSSDAVMEAQRDLVDVVHTLRQVVCVKG